MVVTSLFCFNFENSLSFCFFRFLQFIFIISNIFGCCFIILHIFVSVFIRVFSFIHISDRLTCYSRDYHRSFVLLVFWFLSLLESYIYIYLDCAAKLVLFGVGFSFARTARR